MDMNVMNGWFTLLEDELLVCLNRNLFQYLSVVLHLRWSQKRETFLHSDLFAIECPTISTNLLHNHAHSCCLLLHQHYHLPLSITQSNNQTRSHSCSLSVCETFLSKFTRDSWDLPTSDSCFKKSSDVQICFCDVLNPQMGLIWTT